MPNKVMDEINSSNIPVKKKTKQQEIRILKGMRQDWG